MPHIVAPSLLSADFADLNSAVRLVDESPAPWLHIDVMDGVFVPNISFGFPVIKAIRPLTKKVFDVHLMIVRPDPYINPFRDVGADNLTVHLEACTHLHRTVQAIHSAGMKAGVAINPHTRVEALEDVLADIDLVCLMSVNPGFGGQRFIEHTFNKIERLVALRKTTGSSALIEIDGGVSDANAKTLVAVGADVLVAGNSVFGAKDPKVAIASLSTLAG
ncbi:MAG: ribulose-phosphate 3-epimerase [Flavobacteriales bacterium]|jgi:ribulose-phosphate 3-epimerase|nr:ribulose-phosphate 3-epimerase [Flavobacteriales bacterium]MBK6882772.1 ribulose-phosphate 3-epimerase [Flavobacteriales bacterium]MBK7101764.1 ribulose-phosphate 3-epimerase [Flavobacteriales bacterium]MBK7114114.1 ribulose-phosphate 3-epimerase [Flavobacteriales bacterium]MBK7483832.1 ribulose-phosphate 3-epimerase [Flavobacteriales bacterium]